MTPCPHCGTGSKIHPVGNEACLRAYWQPIETAPRDETPVLVFRRIHGWNVYGVAYWAECSGISGWIARGFSDPPGVLGLASPSHWMPIPPAPNDQEAQ